MFHITLITMKRKIEFFEQNIKVKQACFCKQSSTHKRQKTKRTEMWDGLQGIQKTMRWKKLALIYE